MQSAADLSPAYAAPPSLVPSTNRPFGHQGTYTKRLTVTRGTTMARLTNIDHDAAEWGEGKEQTTDVISGSCSSITDHVTWRRWSLGTVDECG